VPERLAILFGGYGSDSMDRTELTRKAIERGSRPL
jgi:hypothetical protein